jgi:hypothetical protein
LLLEQLFDISLKVDRSPRTRFKKLQNITQCFNALKKEGVSLVGLGPEDIVDANPRLILAFIWVIILKDYQKEYGEGNDSS